ERRLAPFRAGPPHPFQLCSLVKLLPVGVRGGGEPQRPAVGEKRSENAFPGPKRQTGDVVAVDMQDVEHVVVDGDAAPTGVLGVSRLHASLEAGEARGGTLEGDDLTLHPEVARLLGVPRVADLRGRAVEPPAAAPGESR